MRSGALLALMGGKLQNRVYGGKRACSAAWRLQLTRTLLRVLLLVKAAHAKSQLGDEKCMLRGVTGIAEH